jgi:hypothetical protein
MMQDELRKAFKYQDGNLIWLKTGKVAGSKNNRGYVKITFNYKQFFAHRLIYEFHFGETPNIIDHLNGNCSDNRIENLKNTTLRGNQQNRQSHRDGRLVGTSFNKHQNKWRARIRINGVQKLLGYFSTELEAHNKYVNYKELNNG